MRSLNALSCRDAISAASTTTPARAWYRLDDVGDERAGVRLGLRVLDDVDDGLDRLLDRLRPRKLAVVHDADAHRVDPELGRDDARQEERHVDAGMRLLELDAQRRGQHVHCAFTAP
jgi:hypothetical protein